MFQDKRAILEKLYLSLSAKTIIKGSGLGVGYFLVAVTVYVAFNGDMTAITLLSPAIGRLVELLGGNLLSGVIERVTANDDNAALTDEIGKIIEEKLKAFLPDDLLTEREFYRVVSRFIRADNEKYHSLLQEFAIISNLLREIKPSDPAPLSLIPKTSRPLLTMTTLIGREAVFDALNTAQNDVVLTGQPGMGKTFLLYKMAVEGLGLFVLSKNRNELIEAIKEQKPKLLIVDDAHVNLDLLQELTQIRRELNEDFLIVASSWLVGKDQVAETLQLNASNIFELTSLNSDQIVEIIKAAGIHGPNSLIREIREQADGRPGLAITLAQIYVDGGGGDVWRGNILKRTLLSFEKLGEKRASIILGAFALGGRRGMPKKAMAQELGQSLLDLQEQLSSLFMGGVLSEIGNSHLSVQPETLRFALVSDVFFARDTVLDIELFLRHIPSFEETAITLIGAQARGANIPTGFLLQVVERANSVSAWMRYAFLGDSEKQWVLDNCPEMIIHPSYNSLYLVPERVIPLLLSLAIGDHRELGPNPDHPLRMIEDWIQSAVPANGQAYRRRELLLNTLVDWVVENRDDLVCLHTLELVMSPEHKFVEPDPGLGNSVTISSGLVVYRDLEEISQLWVKVFEFIRKIKISNWGPVRNMLHPWMYPQTIFNNQRLPEQMTEFMKTASVQFVGDILTLSEGRPGFTALA